MDTTTDTQEVAMTILRQMGGTGRLSVMIGAKHFLSFGPAKEGSDTGRGLGAVSFQFMKSAGKPNFIRVTLQSDDTYTVEFGMIRGMNFRQTKTLDGMYAEDLKRVFRDETGLVLSL